MIRYFPNKSKQLSDWIPKHGSIEISRDGRSTFRHRFPTLVPSSLVPFNCHSGMRDIVDRMEGLVCAHGCHWASEKPKECVDPMDGPGVRGRSHPFSRRSGRTVCARHDCEWHCLRDDWTTGCTCYFMSVYACSRSFTDPHPYLHAGASRLFQYISKRRDHLVIPSSLLEEHRSATP